MGSSRLFTPLVGRPRVRWKRVIMVGIFAGGALAVPPTAFEPSMLQTTDVQKETLTTTMVAGVVAPASTTVEVLRVGKCSIAPGGPTPEVIAQWEDELRQAATATVANGSVFADTDNLYVYDV